MVTIVNLENPPILVVTDHTAARVANPPMATMILPENREKVLIPKRPNRTDIQVTLTMAMMLRVASQQMTHPSRPRVTTCSTILSLPSLLQMFTDMEMKITRRRGKIFVHSKTTWLKNR